ncbi:MAG TPA: hypothetical protein DCZ01_00395 [Elusimicrobia bacterium]|nr:MAG: hypothetical protein A2X40_11125 [Elusimicrobia bacterium GWC2_65_9]HAZ06992.1 hypothetical protein [Elusimicrobiota bacterium]
MEEGTLDAALEGLLPSLAEPACVKLFGGEPLLRPDLVRRVLERLATLAPGIAVELPTHGGGLPQVADLLSRRPEVEVFVSRPDPRAARLPRVVHNFLIPPGEAPAKTARRFLDARRRGFVRFNFLPAYFVFWTPEQLAGLSAAFAALRIALTRLADAGLPVEVVNRSRTGSTPLYNDGLVVDTDGEVYASNLVLAEAVRPRRGLLRLGHVRSPRRLLARAPADPGQVLAASFPAEIVASTHSADAELTAFCRGLQF